MPILRPFSPSDPDTWPMLLRVGLIVKNPDNGYPGILDISRHAWLSLVRRGLIPPGTNIGDKSKTWPKDLVLGIARGGVAPSHKHAA
jgi:hypothetical protein